MLLTLHPIGTIRTPYSDRYRAPRQPGAADISAEGEIILDPGFNYEQALCDLEGFERIWVIYWFDRNSGWKPKVLTPRGPRMKRGLFATRSPHRPNPIGLSLLRLLTVSGRTVRVADVDILDGTPILDIKPYLPYAEAWPDARSGWLEDAVKEERSATRYRVLWSELAEEQRGWLLQQEIDLAEVALPLLSRDPMPHPYRRITIDRNGFVLAIKSWRVRFHVDGEDVVIDRIESGYSAQTVASGEDLHDEMAHRGFHERWVDGG